MPAESDEQSTHHLNPSGLVQPGVSHIQSISLILVIALRHHRHRTSRLYRLTSFSGLSGFNSSLAKNFFRERVVLRFDDTGHGDSTDGTFPMSVAGFTPEGLASKAGFECFIDCFRCHVWNKLPFAGPTIQPEAHC